MKNEKETKKILLERAKKEFLEKGYMQASLRNICKNAGVTTGALYFFFKDKEDLFAAIVNEPLQKLFEVMNRHYQEESEQAIGDVASSEYFVDDVDAAKQIAHYMYQYYDECTLLITKSQGSKFENCIDLFVEASEKHYRKLTDAVMSQYTDRRLDDYVVHWMTHLQIDMYVHLLTHEKSEEEAMKYMDSMVAYLIAGWKAIIS